MITVSPQMRTLLIRMVLFIAVMMIGAALFMAIEGGSENDSESVLSIDEIKQKFETSYNISEHDFELLVETVRNTTYLSDLGTPWTFGNSLYFVVILVTTIGYGHIAPQTWQGQLFCIFYSLFGIPITAIMLKSVGECITLGVKRFLLFVERRLLRREPDNLETKCFVITLFFMVFMLIFGASVTTATEDWTMMEGLYFTFVTLTTIGFGDYVINDGKLIDKNPAKTAITHFSLVFLILGLGVMASVLWSLNKLIETGGFSCCERGVMGEENGNMEIDDIGENME